MPSKTATSVNSKLFNFRKLRQDFSSNILKQGKELFSDKQIVVAKLVEMDTDSMRFSAKVLGNFENTYECEMELDRKESEMTDSNCDCPYQYDCQHLAAVLYHVEKNIDELVVVYSRESGLEESEELDEEEKAELREVLRKAESKEEIRRGKQFEIEVLQESITGAEVLGTSPFFMSQEPMALDKAELAVILMPQESPQDPPGIQLALRLPYRSKPLNIPNIREFFQCARYREPILISGKRYLFTPGSFDEEGGLILKMLLDHVRLYGPMSDRSPRVARVDPEAFGMLLARIYDVALARATASGRVNQKHEQLALPYFYCAGFEQPLVFSTSPATLRFDLDYLEVPAPKLFLKPSLVVSEEQQVSLDNASFFECAKPGVIIGHTYYRFSPFIKRKHLRTLPALAEMTIPEPLFGTFVENALPELLNFAEVGNREVIDRFVTLPYVEPVGVRCDISYLNGELDASLSYLYRDIKVPAASSQVSFGNVSEFVTEEGILARNLTEEQRIKQDLFQGFTFDKEHGTFVAKSEKKIVEFMTEVVPKYQERVDFHCPENLLDQFIYDATTFRLIFSESEQVDCYQVELQVDGDLEGVTVELLWECVSSRKAYIELERRQKRGRGKVKGGAKLPKILVLDLEKLGGIIQLFDEIGLTKCENYVEHRPLWSLTTVNEELFEDLGLEFSMTDGLRAIQEQIFGLTTLEPAPVPKEVKAELRPYQMEGCQWLEKLRQMHLSGILADDMGLGKTLQAIVTITQHNLENKGATSLIVCPTSLTYNWKEEFTKFNAKLKVLVVDGTPAQRKKLLKGVEKYDVVITSYSLIQKDIETYEKTEFAYAILDEAQHIKNRSTRNAKSVKMVRAKHRLILTGTPIENSLEELWSLFDYLMPGLLSTYERFVEKYIRQAKAGDGNPMEGLRKKVSPFILRRMKDDVLDDLPPVSEIIYHCELSDVQRSIYKSYAKSAREELSRLVNKEGFDKVQIHVLATLTRLKQICCHPGLFAKDEIEVGDSSKYDMLLELLQTLVEGNHKTVIFSQYTRMLKIMREDLAKMGIRFSYLDGSSKNRLEIVKEFNADPEISVFLVSLKAGGSGLNLVGADTVIHYDMWWNPAVESQATDRVHRIGQQSNVSSYKLVTLGTIEEKILEMQNRKKGLVKKVVSCDDEAMAKLTWDEVLELLQT